VLFQEGQTAGGIYILISGRVKLFTTAADGKIFIMKFADPGTLLGLAPAVSGLPYEAWAEATQPTQTAFVERNGLVRAMQNHQEVAVEVAMQLGESYCSAIAEMRVMGLARPASQKLATFLLDWSEGCRPFGATTGEQFTLTHEEIAQRLGISRETVTRLLLAFRKSGLIEWTDGRLVLADRDALESSAAK
jgi:CRP-like cAMP-binding protein